MRGGIQMSENLVKSPEEAMWYVEQDLFDASNPDGVMSITVHQRKDKGVCNVWIKVNREWHRFLPERISEGGPSKILMQGELMRLAKEKTKELQDDIRMKLAVMGLRSAVTVLINER